MRACSVLVVEDYEPFRRFICSTLAQLSDFRIIEASDGLEAVQKAQELQPDLVLIDIGLPKLNGMEVGRQILRIFPHVRLLFVSQESDSDVVRETFRLGAHGYVHKSRCDRDLLPAVEAALLGRPFVSADLELDLSEDRVNRHEVQFNSPHRHD